jgi:hypothetical protein
VIVDRDSLDEALEHLAELADARRRYPDDEGLRQRVRDAVATVRRIARAIERGGVLVLALVALVACEAPQPTNTEPCQPSDRSEP